MPQLQLPKWLNKDRAPAANKALNRLKRLAIAYCAICLLLWLGQERLIFWPSSKIKKTPASHGLQYEEVWLPVSTAGAKAERIHGWWIPAKTPQAPTILYLHHNAINISANISQAEDFHKLGYAVFLIDYRGYGLSEGEFPNEERVYEDAQSAWDYLVVTQQIPPKQIVIYGHSLGSAIAIDLAAKRSDAGALIVQNAFTSLRDMTKRFGIFWLIPVDLLLRQRFDSLEKIRTLKMPVLFIHGTRDPQIPFQMSEVLFATAPEPKQLLLITDLGHDNNMKQRDLGKISIFIEENRK